MRASNWGQYPMRRRTYRGIDRTGGLPKMVVSLLWGGGRGGGEGGEVVVVQGSLKNSGGGGRKMGGGLGEWVKVS